MSKLEFVYVTLIAAPPEKVWGGLTTAEFTEQYWHNTRADSDWQVGSPVIFWVGEENRVGCEGEVLESDYPHKLSHTWSFPNNPEVADEPPSRVTYLLEEVAGGTKLTVRHDRFEEGSRMYEMVAGGWPAVLAGLKTLLETGTAVDFSQNIPPRKE